MFKLLAASALFMVLAIEATNLACKSEANVAVGGVCPVGTVAIQGDMSCCDKNDVYDVDTHACRSESVGPAFFGVCPDGYLVVAGEECCPKSDAYAKQK
ncbi:hypothetical protein CAEBREN_18932 [Caenorhabditis brenneri]|uniref:CC domain-containing protein n=1 Tax=Caenorhabditis brenneri TaxID=135651 RepID=G0NLC5_CAEBE|nr:hypothetical protein CAEBREN_18932 [Caenorhabditis brenneri]